ncbi:hypothetical protein SH1V18_23750 [Vallitalea longa]|uniref:Lipoprotein n=1 Tax=Vallitalea longa TaxID=2936439 RepID=A0A9W6DEU6_9FIRM|nr:hypothetical protein [Vallitalea longa]GKX29895.1 hypothetical protein SH1V18_23750 [Vallitalea longa]
MKKGLKIFIGLVLCMWFIFIISCIGSHKSLAKKLDDNSNFQYATSLTSNYDKSDKANVYTTDMTVQEAAQYLMKEDWPEDYTDLDNNEAIQLTYDDYYVLIYANEDGETYIQISSRKYIHNNGYHGLYRPYRNNIVLFYDTSYTSSRYYTKDNSRYGNGYARAVKNVKTSSSKSTTADKKDTTKVKTDSNKIKPDKNASSKIRTKNSNTSSSKTTNSNTSTSKNTSTSSKSTPKTSHSTSSSSTSRTKSIRSGSVGSKSRLGGGTSFGK